ncbi:MAG: FAD-binding oxidoreductase [Pseudomonadota bacterium]
MSEQASAELSRILGPKGWFTDQSSFAARLIDSRNAFHGICLGLALPGDVEGVQKVMQIAARFGLFITPQGGNTGRVGGATPQGDDTILLGLDRLNRVRMINQQAMVIIAEAGCILADIQRIADENGLSFPLSLGSEGSCQIGGTIATNAGGWNALSTGCMREQVLGLEVVLPDGAIWPGLNLLPKNNTGFDLKQLFIGSEGTLGVVTAAALKLRPSNGDRCDVIASVPTIAAALSCLERLKRHFCNNLLAFEFMHRSCIKLAAQIWPEWRLPPVGDDEWTLLTTITSQAGGHNLSGEVESHLGESLDQGEVSNAILAANVRQAKDFWLVRERIVEAQTHLPVCIKHDLCLPIDRISEFLQLAEQALHKLDPELVILAFGHLGDGNIHYNLQPGANGKKRCHQTYRQITHDLCARLGGSFSAEHGIGRAQLDAMERYKTPVELAMMRTIKQAIDPQFRMNPGVILPQPDWR